MGVYGSYETVRELYQTPVGAVFTARPSGSTTPQAHFVAKVFQADPTIWTPEDSRRQAQLFLDRARLQQKLGPSKFWAGIHECGLLTDGAFLVTDFYPRTAQRLISGRARLTEPQLRRIITHVVQGLGELKAKANRAHGCLKPQNVLIGGDPELERAAVVLDDPHPGPQVTRAGAEAADVRAVGELICHLVLHRAASNVNWPVPHSAEWERLGEDEAENWRTLCNSCLDPNAPLTLDNLRRRLGPDEPEPDPAVPSPRLSRRRIWPAALTTAVLMIGAGALFVSQHRPSWFRPVLERFHHQEMVAGGHAQPGRTTPPATQANEPQILVEPRGPQQVATTQPAPATQPIRLATRTDSDQEKRRDDAAALVGWKLQARERASKSFPGAPVQLRDQWISYCEERLSRVTSSASEIDYERHTTQAKRGFELMARALSQIPARSGYPATSVSGHANGLIARLPDPDAPNWSSACATTANEYQSWCRAVEDTATRLDAVRKIVSDHLPTETVGGKLVADVVSELHNTAKALDDSDPLKDEVAKIESGEERLIAIARCTDKSELVRDMGSKDALQVWAAWIALGKRTDWPQSLQELEQEFSAEQKLAAELKSRPEVATQLKAARQDRWDTHLKLATQQTISNTVEWWEANKPSDLKVPDSFKFDLVLHQYKKQGKSASIKKFLDESGAYAQDPFVRSQLTEFLSGPGTKPVEKRISPFDVKGIRAHHVADEKDQIDCSVGASTLSFLRVPSNDGINPDVFLSQTEVPIEFVAALIAHDQKKYNELSQLLPASQDRLIQGWTLHAENWTLKPRTSSDVHSSTGRSGWCSYDFSPPVASPKEASPMQYVTPEAALYIARLAGCRLPTPAEWAAAYRQSTAQALQNPRKMGWVLNTKLRGSLWEQQLASAKVHGLPPLDEGSFGFEPIAAIRDSRSWSQPPDAGSETTAQRVDRVLFRDVNAVQGETATASFHDLVGNVAEFVIDDPRCRSESFAGNDLITQIQTYFGNFAARNVAVIGGSALSPPSMPLDQPTAVAMRPGEKVAYTDVGFRLAFTDPQSKLPHREPPVIAEIPYVTLQTAEASAAHR